jgi:integrase
VTMAIDQYLEVRRASGLLPKTLDTYRQWLRTLLAPVINRSIRAVIGRGDELYAEAQGIRRADTHRNFLVVGRMWGRFCVRRGLLTESPFAGVDPAGRRTVGADKSRLTVDESRRLYAWCLERRGEPSAVLTLGYLLLGTRAGELCRRDVRDLDDGGRLLWIGRTKTQAGTRRLRVPDELAEALLELATGRPGESPLFRDANDNRMSRDLGHATGAAPAVTARSYVARAATSDAQGDRALKVIQGGRK